MQHARTRTHTQTLNLFFCGLFVFFISAKPIFCTFLHSFTITTQIQFPSIALFARHAGSLSLFPRNVTCTAETQMLNKIKVKEFYYFPVIFEVDIGLRFEI
jgi:hypothetical protein